MLECEHNFRGISVPAKTISSTLFKIGVKLRSSHKGSIFAVVKEVKHEKSPVVGTEQFLAQVIVSFDSWHFEHLLFSKPHNPVFPGLFKNMFQRQFRELVHSLIKEIPGRCGAYQDNKLVCSVSFQFKIPASSIINVSYIFFIPLEFSIFHIIFGICPPYSVHGLSNLPFSKFGQGVNPYIIVLPVLHEQASLCIAKAGVFLRRFPYIEIRIVEEFP